MLIKDMIIVLEAYQDDKEIECKNLNVSTEKWEETLIPAFNFRDYDYRVKPVEPKTIIEYDYGSGLQYISKDAFDSGTPEGIQHYMPYIELTPEVRATLTEKGILKC